MADRKMICIHDKTEGALHNRVRVCAAFKHETMQDFMTKAIIERLDRSEREMLEKLIAEKGEKIDGNN
jgi:hypothetical protein